MLASVVGGVGKQAGEAGLGVWGRREGSVLRGGL